AAARARVRGQLGGQAWSVLQLHLALWPRMLAQGGGLDDALGRFARTALKRQWKRVAERGARLDALTLEEPHAIRKALKGLRYTCEFFSPLYPAAKTRPFIKQLRRLQEVFGYLNDVAAAARLNAICAAGCDSAEARHTAGYILGWHNARAAH